MKITYEKPKITIKHYKLQTTLMVSGKIVYDAGVTNNNVQYTLGTLNS